MTTPQHDRDPRTHAIISAAFDVHREVGAGSYGEGVCRDALAVEFHLRKIPFMTEVPYPVFYKGFGFPACIGPTSSAWRPSSSKSNRCR